jgi:RNA-binding protein YhbY
MMKVMTVSLIPDPSPAAGRREIRESRVRLSHYNAFLKKRCPACSISAPIERRALRARAHSLQPVVSISQNGLTEAVVREVEANLVSHELIKIRVYNDDRQAARTVARHALSSSSMRRRFSISASCW